ncbi:MAG: SpoIIE family protein phosphatase [Magnetococcales bacterium]|nr:SpoIIE family protein phosphatase [Magnetococcales bacterium]
MAVSLDTIVVTRAQSQLLGTLQDEAKQRALQVMSHTLNGNIMGSIELLGMLDKEMKQVALTTLPAATPGVLTTLERVTRYYAAEGTFLVSHDGIVQSSWNMNGKPSTGLDIKFRPYYRIAKQGQSNVYAAIALATNQRALYFAAPVLEQYQRGSESVGAIAIRIGLEQVDATLKESKAIALLVTPQGIVFSSNRTEWILRLAKTPNEEELQTIREAKQFGKLFDGPLPDRLPFDPANTTVAVDGKPYLSVSSPVNWHDPLGHWQLILLGDVTELIPWYIRTIMASLLFFMIVSSAYLIRTSLCDKEAREKADQARQLADEQARQAHMQIVASIQYASRIQQSILPNIDAVTDMINHFVLWLPRDTVGGDIYWMRPWGEGRLIMLADCTGHGVPGAFMTMLAVGAVDRALDNTPVGEVGLLVGHIHEHVQGMLYQKKGEENATNDGLELGACYFDHEGRTLRFSGARFSLFHAHQDEVQEFKGNKFGIGYHNLDTHLVLNETQICLTKDESHTFYMTSDGFLDQIGGVGKRCGFGKKRFIELIKQVQDKPVREQKEYFKSALLDYRGEEEQRDDVTVIGFA